MIKRESFYERHEGLILGGTAVALVLALWEFIWYKHWVSPALLQRPFGDSETILVPPERRLAARGHFVQRKKFRCRIGGAQ